MLSGNRTLKVAAKRKPRAAGSAHRSDPALRPPIDATSEIPGEHDPKQVRRRDASATRARILEAAMGEFAAKGLDARIEDIAEMAGANRRMAYWYFGSKEGLYLAALEATYLELVEVERRIDVDALGPLEAIAALVSAKFEHYVRYPRYIEFLKIENLYQARHLKASTRIREMRGPLVALLKRVLERGQALGVLRSDVDPVELYIAICAIGFFAFSNRFTLGVIFDEDITRPESLERRRKLIVDMVTAYLTAGVPAPTTTSGRKISREKSAMAAPKLRTAGGRAAVLQGRRAARST